MTTYKKLSVVIFRYYFIPSSDFEKKPQKVFLYFVVNIIRTMQLIGLTLILMVLKLLVGNGFTSYAAISVSNNYSMSTNIGHLKIE